MFTVWVIAMGLAVMLAGLCAVAGRGVFRSSGRDELFRESGQDVNSGLEDKIRPACPVLTGWRAGGVADWRGLAGRHFACADPDDRCRTTAPGARAVRLEWTPSGVRSAELTAIT